jgi:hypothetical protein
LLSESRFPGLTPRLQERASPGSDEGQTRVRAPPRWQEPQQGIVVDRMTMKEGHRGMQADQGLRHVADKLVDLFDLLRQRLVRRDQRRQLGEPRHWLAGGAQDEPAA